MLALFASIALTQTYPVLVNRTLTEDGGAYTTGLTSAEVDVVASVTGPIADAGLLTIVVTEGDPQNCNNVLSDGQTGSLQFSSTSPGASVALTPLHSSCLKTTWAVQGTSTAFAGVNVTLVNRTAIASGGDAGAGVPIYSTDGGFTAAGLDAGGGTIVAGDYCWSGDGCQAAPVTQTCNPEVASCTGGIFPYVDAGQGVVTPVIAAPPGSSGLLAIGYNSSTGAFMVGTEGPDSSDIWQYYAGNPYDGGQLRGEFDQYGFMGLDGGGIYFYGFNYHNCQGDLGSGCSSDAGGWYGNTGEFSGTWSPYPDSGPQGPIFEFDIAGPNGRSIVADGGWFIAGFNGDSPMSSSCPGVGTESCVGSLVFGIGVLGNADFASLEITTQIDAGTVNATQFNGAGLSVYAANIPLLEAVNLDAGTLFCSVATVASAFVGTLETSALNGNGSNPSLPITGENTYEGAPTNAEAQVVIGNPSVVYTADPLQIQSGDWLLDRFDVAGNLWMQDAGGGLYCLAVQSDAGSFAEMTVKGQLDAGTVDTPQLNAGEVCLGGTCNASWPSGGVTNPNLSILYTNGLETDGGDVDTGGHLQSHGTTPLLLDNVGVGVTTTYGFSYPPDAGKATWIVGTDVAGTIYFGLDGGQGDPSYEAPADTNGGTTGYWQVQFANPMPSGNYSVICQAFSSAIYAYNNTNSAECNMLQVNCAPAYYADNVTNPKNAFDVRFTANLYGFTGEGSSSALWSNANSQWACALSYQVIGYDGGVASR